MREGGKRQKNELSKAIKREQTRNYIILFSVTAGVLVILILVASWLGFYDTGNFVENIINNIIGILPPILIFDIFFEKLSRDASSTEMSNKITEALMSNPEMLKLFTEEQRRDFIKATISSIVEDEDATQMIDESLNQYLTMNHEYRIRTNFDYNFELNENLPSVYSKIVKNSKNYFYVQEKLHYHIKYLSPSVNNTDTSSVCIGFVFDNKSLDDVLREKKNDADFDRCIFRESLDIEPEDIEAIKSRVTEIDEFRKIFKFDLQVDNCKGRIDQVLVKDEGIICKMVSEHDVSALEHDVRIIFHMPKRWNSNLEVALVDPTKAPKISVSYPEDRMDVEMYSFLTKGEESSHEVAHNHMNGIYDISISNDWIYPIGGMVFTVTHEGTRD